MAVSEMVSSNSLLWGSEKTRRRADHRGEPEPRSVQIAGADPSMMADAARYNVDHGAQIIDINMGCPAKKICNVMAGSALLQHEALVAEILNSVVKAVDVPVTLKLRTGWDTDNRNGLEIARIAEDCGIQLLAVHGRTRACAYRGEAEYDTIAAIKAGINIPVVANGDIGSPEKALEVLRHTGADGVMIGRAAQGRPWLFGQIDHFLKTGKLLPDPTPAEKHTIVIEHLDALYEFYGERIGIRMARKHIAWYRKGLQGGAAFRQAMNRLETVAEQRDITDEFFSSAQQALVAAA